MANLKDFATGTVASAPSPATSGTSIVLQSGEGARMPAVPFYATAHPDYQLPTLDNAEKILVTAKSTDTLTVTRAQGGTTAKSIAAGWRISNAIFAADLFNTSLVTGETPGGSINGSNTAFTVSSAFSTGSLRVFLNGQRLTPGSGNDYTENASGTGFTMEYAPATGDVLRVDYNIGNTAIGYGTNTFITDEEPTGSVNGSNTSFTTLRPYVASTLEVFINGLKQARITHVTESSPSAGTFTLDTAPATGDIVRVNYQYATSAGGNADTVDGYQADDLMPIGGIMPYAGINAPSSNWLFCFGQAVSRTTYATLFQRLSTTYGTGDGSTTFNLPDLRGRVIAGQDDMGGTSANRLTGASGGVDGDVLGAVGGAETHTLTIAEIPAHAHNINPDAGSGGSPYTGTTRGPAAGGNFNTSNTGGGGAHNNVQPTIICNYIIKAL